jgi:hypothetical protein
VETLTTDDNGYFRVGKLQPATYSVVIEAAGFGNFTAEQVIVQVGTVTEIPIHLKVGAANATVLVSAEIPQVNTTSPEFAPTLDQDAISNLPINGGRWSSFVLLTPGAVNDSSGFGLISFRGMSTLLNNNTVDGGDNNQAFFSEERGRTRIGYSSAKAAVQEFQVNTSNYSAEYGRAAGAVVNTVTKSGTNQYHGEVYFYDRDNSWGAINPFTTLTDTKTLVTSTYKPTDVRKMYGFGIGGPILKDKLFFFLAFDRYDRNFPGTAKAGSPSAFFAFPVDAAGTLLPTTYTFDGSSNCLKADGKTSNINSKNFTMANGGNIATATVGACTMLVNLAGAGGTAGISTYADAVAAYKSGLSDVASETGPVPRNGLSTIFFPKLDWQINSKNHATAEVNRTRWASPAGIQTQASNTFGIASFGNDYVRDTWGVAKLYTSITSATTNEARFQYGRDFEFEFAQPPSTYEKDRLLSGPGYTNSLGLPPDVTLTGNGFDIGVPTFLQRPAFPDETRTQYADTISLLQGKHAFKFGMDVAHTHDLSQNLRFQYGSFNYSTLGNYFSDLLQPSRCGASHSTPCYGSYQQAFGPLGFTFNTNDYAFFVEDSWRVAPRLTLNLGLRYEYEKLPSVLLPNPAVFETKNMPSDANNLGPRIGFAWDITGDGKTALRGGYGIFYGRVINSTIYNALVNTGEPGGQFSYSFSNTTPGAPKFPRILGAQPTTKSALSVVYFDQAFQLPKVHETDLTVEREIAKDTVVSVSYLGSFGRDLPNFVDTNIAPSPRTITYTVTGGGPLSQSTYTTPYYVGSINTTVKSAAGATLSNVTVNTRPNLNFGAMTKIFSGVNSNYNALAIQLSRRMTQHVQFLGSYTWSHSLDNGTNGSTFTDTNDLLDPMNINKDYGTSVYNVPNRFVASAILENPWHVSGPVGYLTNDWQLAPIYSAQSGLPYSLVTSGNPSVSTTSTDAGTGNVTTVAYNGIGGGVNGSNGRKGIDVIGRDSFKLKRTINMDLRLSKKIRFTESKSFEILGEAFNLFNHQNVTSANSLGYFLSGTSLSYNSGFGKATNANSNFAYTQRQVQIGFRFFF